MQHNFKLYKSGKHWVYAGSIMLAVAGGIVLINNPTAEADMVADNANVSTSVGSQSASPSSTMILASVATSEASSASATSNASYSNSQSATSLASSEVGSVASSTSASLSSSSSESVATTSSSASSSASSLVNTSSLSSSVSAIKLAVAARTMRTQAALVAPTIIDSGVRGTAPWILDSNGLLTIGKTAAGVVTNGTIQAYDRPAQFSPSGTDGALIKAVVVASGANIILDGTTYAPGVPAGQIAPQLFTGLANLVNVDLTGMTENSNVSTLNDMFAFDYNLANVVIPKGIVTQNVTSLNGMFRGDKTLTNIDLSNFDTSNVTNMAHMFDLYDPTLTSTTTPEPSSLTLNLTSFDTSKVTDMSNMFNDLPIYSLDLSNFNTANVTNMSYMFVGTHLRALDLSNFNTTKVTNMVGMFAGNSVLSNINLSSFDTSNVTDMSFIFSDDDFLQSIDISNFSSKSLNNFGTNGMFQDSPELQEIKLGSNWSFSPDGSPHEWGNSPLKGVVPWLGRYGYAPTLNADGTISSGGMSIQTYPRITAPDQQNGYFTGLWQELGNSTNILQPNGQVITNEGLVNLPVGSATGTWVVQHMPVTFFNATLGSTDSGTFTNTLGLNGDGVNGVDYDSNETTAQAGVPLTVTQPTDGYQGTSNLSKVLSGTDKTTIITIRPTLQAGLTNEGPDSQTISATILNVNNSTGVSPVLVTTKNSLPGLYDIWTVYGTSGHALLSTVQQNANAITGSSFLTVVYTANATTVLGQVVKSSTGDYDITDMVTSSGLPNATYTLNGSLVDLANNSAVIASGTVSGVYDASGKANVPLTYTIPLAQYAQLLTKGAQLQSHVTGTSTTINNMGNITANADGTYSLTSSAFIVGKAGDNFRMDGTLAKLGNPIITGLNATTSSTGTFSAYGYANVQIVYTLTKEQYVAVVSSLGDTDYLSSDNVITDTTDSTVQDVKSGSLIDGSFVKVPINVDPTLANEEQDLSIVSESGVTSINGAIENPDGTYTINDSVKLTGGLAGDNFTLNGTLVDLTNSANLASIPSSVTGVFATDGSATATISYKLTANQYLNLERYGDTIESQVTGSDTTNSLTIAMDPTYTGESLVVPKTSIGATKISNVRRNVDGSYTVNDTVTLTGGTAGHNYELDGSLVDLTATSRLDGVISHTIGVFDSNGNAETTLSYTVTADQYTVLLTAGDTIESQVTGKDTTNNLVVAMDPTYTGESLMIPKVVESGVTKISNAIRNADGSYTISDAVTLTGGLAGNDFTLKGMLLDLTTPGNLSDLTGETIGTFDNNGKASATILYTLTTEQYDALLISGDTVESRVVGNDTTNNLTIAMDPTYTGESLAIPKITESGVTNISNANRNADGSYTIDDAVTLAGGLAGDTFALNGMLVDLTTPSNLVNVIGVAAGSFSANGTATATITYTLTGAQYTALLNAGDTIESQVTGRDTTNDLTITMDPTYTGESLAIPKIAESGVTSINNAVRNADGSYTINDAVTLVGGLAGDAFALNGTLVDLTTPGNLSGLTGTATGSFDSNGKATATISYTLTTTQYDALLTAGDTVESQVIGNDSTNNLVIAMDPTYTGESLTLPKISESGVTQINRAVQNADGSYTVDDAVTLTGGQPGDQFVLDGRLVDISIAGNLVNVTALSTGVFGADGTATATLVYHLSAEQFALLATAGDTIESQVTGVDTTNGLTIQMDPTYTGESEAIPKTPVLPAQPKVVTPKTLQVSSAKLPATGTESQAGILELGEAMSLIALLGLLDILRKRKSSDGEI